MAILNSAGVRPSAIAVILRAIASFGKSGIEKDLLKEIISPKNYDVQSKTETANEIQDNLSAILYLKLAIEDNGKLALNPIFFNSPNLREYEIAKSLRRAILSDESNDGDWKSPSYASEFTNSVAWFLTLPTSGVSTTFDSGSPNIQELQSRLFGDRVDDGWVLGNANRWNAFKHWSCSLGFAYLSAEKRIVPDPTIAIRDDIDCTFPHLTEMPATEFIKKISENLPVLDGGKYRTLVEEHLRSVPEKRNGRIFWVEIDSATSRSSFVAKRSATDGRPSRPDRPTS